MQSTVLFDNFHPVEAGFTVGPVVSDATKLGFVCLGPHSIDIHDRSTILLNFNKAAKKVTQGKHLHLARKLLVH
jgi:hypothetical protein